jgi:hypothetical protein
MKDFRGRHDLTLGIRNNNPGNLRPGHDWQGMVGENQGFVVYENIHYGIRALIMDVTNKMLRGLDTVQKIVSVYAPPTENLTGNYIQAVCDHLHVKYTDVLKLNDITVLEIVEAIIEHENGKKDACLITGKDIGTAFDMIPANLKDKLIHIMRQPRF